MWTRQELKQKAKQLFNSNYWKYVIATFVFALLTVASTSSGRDSSSDSGLSVNSLNLTNRQLVLLTSIILIAAATIAVISIAVDILVRNPIRVGYARFLLKSEEDSETTVGYMFSSLKGNYISSALKMFTTKLIIVLYTMLFVIPGIIKAYQFRLVEFILAENPDMSAHEARMLSKDMMYGQKWNAFVLDLSFIGWHLLSAMTAGILSVFYVKPYVELTEMYLYKAIKEKFDNDLDNY